MTHTDTPTSLPAGAPSRLWLGVLIGLISALGFSLAGPFGKALADGDWSPVATASVRTGGGALLLLVPAILAWRAARPDRGDARSWAVDLLTYGTLGVAGVQVFFYTGIQYAPVAIVLLIEFTAPVLLVAWSWLRTGVRPPGRVFVGSALAVVGLVLVIGLVGGGAVSGGVHPLGLFWAVAGAVCLACYFKLADAHPNRRPVPLMTLAGGGLTIGFLTCALVGASGLLPVRATFGPVPFASGTAPWWVPAGGLALGAGAIAYALGALAVRRLGSRNASFLALSEVLLAAGLSWIVLGEALTAIQGVGALAVLGGVILVQAAGRQPADEVQQGPVG